WVPRPCSRSTRGSGSSVERITAVSSIVVASSSTGPYWGEVVMEAGYRAGGVRAGEDPQVARCAGRRDEIRPLGVPAARWYSLRVRRNGRLSGEPPHMSDKKSLLGSPPSLCASTVGAAEARGNGFIDL